METAHKHKAPPAAAAPDSTPVPIPAAQWVGTIEIYTNQYGTPRFLPVNATVENATDAIWGSGESELHLVKANEQEFAAAGTVQSFICCKDQSVADSVFKALHRLYPHIKVDPEQFTEAYRTKTGIQLRTTTFRSVYVHEGQGDLEGNDVVCGVVTHNPNYPDMI